jgi:hypothetical protein
MRRCVWSRNHKNEEAMAHVGQQRQRKQTKQTVEYNYVHLDDYWSAGMRHWQQAVQEQSLAVLLRMTLKIPRSFVTSETKNLFCTMWKILIVLPTLLWNTCVTWQGIDYKLPEDDTIVSKHVGVTICEIIVHLLVIVQNNKRCTVQVLK